MGEYLLILLFVFITGACIGSFLNVAALRAISGESIILPPSKCPKCSTPIKWFDNIPIISYFLIFKGKCRQCREKVSIQYPIVEILTAVIFTIVFMVFGISVKTLLLLILLCIAIVISITDIKKEYIYDIHNWIFIITALIYSINENGIYFAFIGFLAAAVIMEIIAKLSYYLIRKNNTGNTENTEKAENTENTEESDINAYINKYKRAFGEGDTYLAAGCGAILGIKYFIAAAGLAIILQAVCILPQFLINLYKKQEKRLLSSICAFIILSVIYFLLINLFKTNLFITLPFIIALIYFAVDSIIRLKRTTFNNGYGIIPFGPALLISTFLMLFFGNYIVKFVKQIIF